MELSVTGNLQKPEHDRVRSATRPEFNLRIDREIEKQLKFYSYQDRQTITERIHELDAEWDVERVLMTNAASLSLFGVTMSIISGRKWLTVPLVVGSFLLQHAVQGWCPPLPILRKMGVRTRSEIELEKYALKILRGDFDNLEKQEDGHFKRDIQTLVKDLRTNGRNI